MSRPTDLEERLTTLFESQARAIRTPPREWEEARPRSARASRPGWPGRRVAVGLAALAPLVLALAIATIGQPSQQVTTGAGSPPPLAAAPLKAETRQVSMVAEAISIDVGGKRFVPAQPLEVHSDPGSPEYTTLELSWQEHGVEMRMNIYFTSDGREWGSKEIRTYDGHAQGEWITYEGDFFRTPVGLAFSGDLDVTSSNDRATGRLRMSNVRLEAFGRPAACTKLSGPYALEPAGDAITIDSTDGSAGYSTSVKLLDTASCTPVTDLASFTFDWKAQDPGIVTVDANGPEAALKATAPGSTTLHVTALDRRTGEVVGKASIDVVVRSGAAGATGGGPRSGPPQP